MLDFKKYKSSSLKDLARLNYLMIPVNRVTVDEYNEILQWCIDNPKLTRGIERTRSGGISLQHDYLNKFDATPRMTRSKHCVGAEILIIQCDVQKNKINHFCGRFQIGTFRGSEESEKHICGRQAYFELKKILEKNGLHIEDKMLSREEGIEYKKKIQQPMIDIALGAFPDVVYENVYHIDINSSYGSGMAEIVPEWANIIEDLYINRHIKKINKDILNMSIGFFQSAYVEYRLSYISEYCIRRNNEKLCEKAIDFLKKGCKILLYNTDGFWFQKPKDLEIESSSKLGEFKIDHRDCKFRMKSKGIYEFIENGHYFPVVRGQCEMDKLKNRTEWQWGDIYSNGARVIVFEFDKKTGFIKQLYLEDVEA